MQIYHTLTPAPAPQDSAVALGYFDGVHSGHRAVLGAAVTYAAQHGLTAAAFTFELPGNNSLKGGRILSLAQKHTRVAQLGIAQYWEPSFEEFRALSPEDFVRRVLVDCFHAKAVFCGDNFTFGAYAAGNVALLEQLCAPYGITVDVVPMAQYGGQTVSSTRIRAALEEGRLDDANAMLGKPYAIDWAVTHGKGIGSGKLGTPTINQNYPAEALQPCTGVYLTRIWLDGQWRPAATGIGRRPTVDSSANAAVTCETFVPDYAGNVYGRAPVLEFHKYLCPVRKFGSMDELAALIHHAAEESKPGLVEKIELRDWNAQGEYVAQRAKALASGKTLGVLFRNGDSLPALADALQKAGVPFVRSRRDGLPPLFTSPAMRALRAAIKLSFNPCDIDSFRILKNRIKKDLPNYIVNQIAAADEDVFEGIEGRVSLSRGELESLERKRKAVAGYKKLRALPAVSAIIDDFYLDGRGGVNQKTDALLSLAMGVETVDDYIAKLNEMEVFLSSEDAGHGRVFLSTIHAAKGLEYDEVILCDGRAGILPQHDSVDTPEDRREREEETRLMYVAVTRARERFSFLCASHSHGAAAPASLYLGRIFPPIGRRPVQSAPVRTFHSGFTPVSPRKNSTTPLPDFTGKRVVHKKFGQGDVLKVEKGAALIRFADGEKRIDLRAALDCGAISPAGD